MTVAWAIDWSRGARDRRDLADRVQATLQAHEWVDSIQLFGSLASREPDGYPADLLSDIDIRVVLSQGSDRQFFEALPQLLGEVAPVLLKNAFVTEVAYIAGYMFESYSPFWHVDVVCCGPSHLPGADLLEANRHARAFGSWVSAVKRFVKANEFLDYFLELVPDEVSDVQYAPKRYFEGLLENWYQHSNDPVRLGIGREILDHIPLPP